MEAVIFCLAFYGIPAVLAYFIIRKNLSTKYKNLKPSFIDMLFVFLPYYNIVIVLVEVTIWISDYIKKEKEGKTLPQRFFRL